MRAPVDFDFRQSYPQCQLREPLRFHPLYANLGWHLLESDQHAGAPPAGLQGALWISIFRPRTKRFAPNFAPGWKTTRPRTSIRTAKSSPTASRVIFAAGLHGFASSRRADGPVSVGQNSTAVAAPAFCKISSTTRNSRASAPPLR